MTRQLIISTVSLTLTIMSLSTILHGQALAPVELNFFSDSLKTKKNTDTVAPRKVNHNDWTAMQLKGNVKTMKETEYGINADILKNFGQIQESTEILRASYVFSIIGNTMEYNRYNSEGGLICKFKYKYDSIGLATESNSFDDVEKLLTKTTYKYDNNGYLTEKNSYNSAGGIKEKWILKYDSNGNNTEENHFDPNGKLVFKFTLKYDEKGNAIEGNSYTKKGDILYKYTYRYDKNNNLVEVNVLEPNGVTVNRIVNTYSFDKNGNWLKRISYRMDISNAVHKNDVPTSITKREIEYF